VTTQHLVRRRTGRLAVVTSVLVTWVVLAAAGTAHASPPPEDRKRDVEAHLDQAEHELHHSSAAVQKAAAALKRTAVELPKAQARLADARAKLATATAVARRADAEAARAASAVAASTAQLDGAAGDLAAHRASLGEIARSAYIRGPAPQVQMIFGAVSAEQLVTREVYVDRVMRHQADLIGAVGHARDRISSERVRLDIRRVDAQQRKDAAEEALARVTTLTQAAARAEQAVRRQIALRTAALAAAERERALHQAEVTRLAAESRRLEELIRRLAREKAARIAAARLKAARAKAAAARAAAAQAARDRARARSRPAPTRRPPRTTRTTPRTPAPAPTSSGLMWPTPGPLTSSYGWRVHPIFGTRRLHAGIDIGAPSGQSVRAAAGEWSATPAGWVVTATSC
jgi:murein DD-endopeptidase MepM/ murein hydrolase activator NlpD